jgi:hypothetical protein
LDGKTESVGGKAQERLMTDSFQTLIQLLTTHNTKLASLLGLTSWAARKAATGEAKDLVREELGLHKPSWQPSWQQVRALQEIEDALHMPPELFQEDTPTAVPQKTRELGAVTEPKPEPTPVPVEQPVISEEAVKAAALRVKQAKWDLAKEREKAKRRKKEKSLMEYAELARRAASPNVAATPFPASGAVTPVLRHLLNDSDTQ